MLRFRGHAAYYYGVDYNATQNKKQVGATYYMAYHSVCKTSADYTDALRQARILADNITKAAGVEVFPYSFVTLLLLLDCKHS